MTDLALQSRLLDLATVLPSRPVQAEATTKLDADFERDAVARFPLLTAADLANRPPARALLKGLVHEGDIGAVHGSWGDGKSFIAIDMLHAMSEGVDWFGYRCRRSVPCLYIGLEGQASVPKRVKALLAEKGTELPRLRFLLTALDIRNQVDLEQLITSIRAHGFDGGALCLDTFNASTLGMAENTSEDMGQAIAAAKHLQREFGGVVILVHHSGKSREQGMRGHSSLEGAVDFIIEVARNPDRKNAPRKMLVRKVKDGQDGAEFAFDLKQVELGSDEDGDPINSAVVVRVLTEAEQAVTHTGAMVLENERLHDEAVVLRGFRRLADMGIKPTDAKNSGDYLPRKLGEMGLADGCEGDALSAAMRRLMSRGVLIRGPVGHYANRTPKLGLILTGEVT